MRNNRVKCKASGQEIWSMRSCLQYEGWVEDENLPEGWMYRLSDSGEMCCLSPRAEVFTSMEAVKKEISGDEYFSGSDNVTLGDLSGREGIKEEIKEEWIDNEKNFCNDMVDPDLIEDIDDGDIEDEFISLEEAMR